MDLSRRQVIQVPSIDELTSNVTEAIENHKEGDPVIVIDSMTGAAVTGLAEFNCDTPTSALELDAYRYAAASCEDTTKHSSTKGHVVGASINGRKQPRNQPCSCGSGKKAKKCCVYEKGC